MFAGHLQLKLTDVCKKVAGLYKTINIVLHFFKYIINMPGDRGSLSTSKMEFFTRIFNSWKQLTINYCLKKSHLRCSRVPESTFVNQITVATFLLRLLLFTEF